MNSRDVIITILDAELEKLPRPNAWALLQDLALDIEQRLEGLRDTEKPEDGDPT